MTWSFKEAATVEAELNVPAASAQIVRFNMPMPTDRVMHQEDCYWLDLCLTPRPMNARAGYSDRWGPHRFERLGDIFLVPPRQAMHVKTDGGAPQASVVCKLRSNSVAEWLGAELDWTDRRLEAGLDISSNTIKALLYRLAEEARRPGFGGELLVELIAGQLAIEVARYCEAVTDAPISGGLASWRLRLIDERLMEMREPPTLSELADLCNLSVRQLTRGFRTSRGCSIGDYVVQSRINKAKRLLGGEESVKAIAFAVGFSSASSFSYAFRRATGTTPRQYRQRMHRVRH